MIYPEGVAKMPVSPLWSILFFFMLFTIGLDSQVGSSFYVVREIPLNESRFTRLPCCLPSYKDLRFRPTVK